MKLIAMQKRTEFWTRNHGYEWEIKILSSVNRQRADPKYYVVMTESNEELRDKTFLSAILSIPNPT